MVCDPCAEHFKFSRHDVVREVPRIKSETVKEAKRKGCEEAGVKRLELALNEYSDRLEACAGRRLHTLGTPITPRPSTLLSYPRTQPNYTTAPP